VGPSSGRNLLHDGLPDCSGRGRRLFVFVIRAALRNCFRGFPTGLTVGAVAERAILRLAATAEGDVLAARRVVNVALVIGHGDVTGDDQWAVFAAANGDV
jgi:hypothetical protein